MKRRNAGVLLTNALRGLVREELRKMRSEVEDKLGAALSVRLDALTSRLQRFERRWCDACAKCGKRFTDPHLYEAHMLAEKAIDEHMAEKAIDEGLRR